jgi:PBSX family phage terminase large subunit
MVITLSDWQTKVIDDTHRFKVINCGRRAGKSFLVSIKLLDFASNNPKSIVWYISPNYKQSKSIMWTMLRDIIPQHGISKTNETELKIELKNGSQILLKGAEDPDSLRGVRIDFCVFDEVAFIDKWNEVWKVVRPTLIDSKASCWFISTPNGFNHFKEMYENVAKDGKPVFAPSDWVSFHYTSYDNPYLDKLELENARATTDEDSFAQEYMGEFRKMVGLIYKDFNRDIHMVDIPQLDYNYSFTRALDFGFAHKTALIYFAINSRGDAIYAYDGLYQEGLTERQIADVVKTKDVGRVITNPVADSAQPMSIEQLKEFDVRFEPIEKAPDSVKNGIVKVAELLKIRNDTGKPTLMFNKDMPWIADEFERYRWMENKSAGNAIKEVPNKVNDDAMDAIRYFAMEYKKQTNDEAVPDDTNDIANQYATNI